MSSNNTDNNTTVEDDTKSISKPTDITSLAASIPFSSLAMVIVLAITKPDQFFEVLELGKEYFGVGTPALIGGGVVAGIAALMLLQLLFRGVMLLLSSFTSWRDDGEAMKRERQALIDIFNATGGKCWRDKTRWCGNEPVSRWKGVKIDPQNGHVVKIILPSNNLAGKLPGAPFLHLPYLLEIDMRENKLEGPIPDELGQLYNLEGLYLYDNYFTGKIPRSLLQLPRLIGIYLFSNHLEGVDEMREAFKQKMKEDGQVFI